MAIEKCCVRWDLEFGFFTCGIITLMVKIYAASMLFFVFFIIGEKNPYLIPLVVCVFSWLIATVGMQFVALIGIVQKKSILLQPYFVVLLLEPFILLLFTIYLCLLVGTVGFILVEVFTVSVDIYSAMCLRSLYKKYLQQEERLQPTGEILEF